MRAGGHKTRASALASPTGSSRNPNKISTSGSPAERVDTTPPHRGRFSEDDLTLTFVPILLRLLGTKDRSIRLN
jgi:hypothetical protein